MAAEKQLKIVVDDGRVRVPIENKEGDEVGVFYFMPTDIAIVQRFNKAADQIGEIMEPLTQIGINADGTAEDDDDAVVNALDEAEKRLFELCDYIFGGNMSEAFFGQIHPFALTGGTFYCESVLNAVGAFITDQFSQETKKLNQRVKKYVGKYGSGRSRK